MERQQHSLSTHQPEQVRLSSGRLRYRSPNGSLRTRSGSQDGEKAQNKRAKPTKQKTPGKATESSQSFCKSKTLGTRVGQDRGPRPGGFPQQLRSSFVGVPSGEGKRGSSNAVEWNFFCLPKKWNETKLRTTKEKGSHTRKLKIELTTPLLGYLSRKDSHLNGPIPTRFFDQFVSIRR